MTPFRTPLASRTRPRPPSRIARRAELVAIVGTAVYASLLGAAALALGVLAVILFLFGGTPGRGSVSDLAASMARFAPIPAGVLVAIGAMWWLYWTRRFHLVAWAHLIPVGPAAVVWATYDGHENEASIRPPPGTCDVRCLKRFAPGGSERDFVGSLTLRGAYEGGNCRVNGANGVRLSLVDGELSARAACNAHYDRCSGECWVEGTGVDAGR